MAVLVIQLSRPMTPLSEISYWPFPPLRQGLTEAGVHLIQLGWLATGLQGSTHLQPPQGWITGKCHHTWICHMGTKYVTEVCCSYLHHSLLTEPSPSLWLKVFKHCRVSKKKKKVHICYLNPPSLWHFVIIAFENQHRKKITEIHQSNNFGDGLATLYHYTHMHSPTEGKACAQHEWHTWNS